MNMILSNIANEVTNFYAEQFGGKLNQVWLFGSQINGGNTHDDSDVDVMVVVDGDMVMSTGYNDAKYDLVMDMLRKYNEMVSIIVTGSKEFNNSGKSIYNNVKKGSLVYEK
ncbi:MAG: nucleotidyltransferase domain-containing protein [Defluviitaleaceae bacterium]|nr:nucleotidyltransferase domain-containing protein [Defluviitaleaceae bacterium]